jgi:acetyl-CoA carboxylase biotin carboxyl carrier protein
VLDFMDAPAPSPTVAALGSKPRDPHDPSPARGQRRRPTIACQLVSGSHAGSLPTREPGHHRPAVGSSAPAARPAVEVGYAVYCHATGQASQGESDVANVEAHITGTVWKIEVEVGDTVEEGDTVVILESMKMEMPVEAEEEGRVKEILCQEGQSVSEGDALVVLE